MLFLDGGREGGGSEVCWQEGGLVSVQSGAYPSSAFELESPQTRSCLPFMWMGRR